MTRAPKRPIIAAPKGRSGGMMAGISGRLPMRDVKVISLVGTAHGFSHFYQLAPPPLFPVVRDALGVSCTELGAAMTAFYAASGLLQTPAGFLVDRFGARRVLYSGLALMAAATGALALASSFWALVPLMALAGCGNSVFHPSD